MNIGIIGSGAVAQVIGGGFAGFGHKVMIGTRDASKIADWLSTAGENVSTGSFEEAAKFGEVVFLSVNYTNVESALDLTGRENLAGKVVVDLTNPMDFSKGVPPAFAVTYGNSLGEQHQRMLPDAKVVKAFNSMGANVMTTPIFNGEAATHFIAGNDDAAKVTVKSLVEEFGWEVLDAGDIGQAFFLEALASLWVNYSIKSGERDHAFKLLVR